MRRFLNISRYPEYIRLLLWRNIVPIRMRMLGVDVSSSASFFGMPIVSKASESQIKIGERVTLCSNSLYTALGVNHPVVLRTLRPKSVIEIGADTGMSGTSICAATYVSIGMRCLIGANVTISDTDFHAIKSMNRRFNTRFEDIATKSVHIGNDVFLGAGVIVLKGVTIGDGAVVGAGSVVVKNIPSHVIAAGNPAQVLRTIHN